jgi:dGTPase
MRIYKEQNISVSSNPYMEDAMRIIGTNAFRRLGYKTQVFVNDYGDHYRTRLTHSMEVGILAKEIASRVSANEDLCFALGISHDIGHPPLGHIGENIINKVLSDYSDKKFNHNYHGFFILTKMETISPMFDGLNLTIEFLESMAKHNGAKRLIEDNNEYVINYFKKHNLDLSQELSANGKIAAIADDITYICHDIEDGIKANFLTQEQIYEYLDFLPIKNCSVRSMITMLKQHFVTDLIQNNLSFSKECFNIMKNLREFLFDNLYLSSKIADLFSEKQRRLESELKKYLTRQSDLPKEWILFIENNDINFADGVCYYLACMTDRYLYK